MKTKLILPKLVYLFLIILLLSSCSKKHVRIQNGDLIIEFDNSMYSSVNSAHGSSAVLTNAFQVTEFLITKNFTAKEFKLLDVVSKELDGEFGVGVETKLTGKWEMDNTCLTKMVSVRAYDIYPGMAFYDVSYVNCGNQDLHVNKWVNHNYSILSDGSSDEFWAFQGSSTANRDDWIKPVAPGYYQKNYMGMNHSDYGGGIPITDLWRKDAGIAIGHVEMVPREVSLPVDYDKYTQHAQISIEQKYNRGIELLAGDTLKTHSTFISVHTGDFFTTMRSYSQYMQARGIEFVEMEDAAFESIWCGWGYERKFTAEEIINTLPKVKELGIKWAVIDDGFQIAEGDWRVDIRRFPGGDKDMKRMVNGIHDHGLKAKLWWAPLAADPGSKILEESPEVLLMNESGAPQYITWWDSYYMSPASEATIKHTKETVEMFMQDWGFDGLKMDGQHMNAVPPDYNWDRPLEYPEKSIEMLPEFFKMIYENAREIKPNAVIENCPCGTCMSFYNMPYTNQTVSSDAESSWQLRHRGKTYKAIMPQTAYYGDHVENTDDGADFASSFGVGAVLGTKFTWPKDNPNVRKSYLLTPEKEVVWKKWFGLYNEMMLSREEYLGELYDIGFDKPETHVIQKGDTVFYAFYAEDWNGEIELRGLKKGEMYVANDYVNEIEVATFNGDNPLITCAFKEFLLIEVYLK